MAQEYDPNLVLDDEYVTDVGVSCKQRGLELEEIYAEYTATLASILETAVLGGAFADELSDYVKNAVVVCGSIQETSELLQKACKSFLGQINQADSDLF